MTDRKFYTSREYKEKEKSFNQSILRSLDCEYFIKLIGVMLELHLKQVEYTRKYSKMLGLTHHYPTKEEVTDVTRIWIRLESRYDELEMSLYDLNNNINESTTLLKKHNQALGNLHAFLKDECSTSKKIDRLKDELRHLKNLF